MVAKQVLYVENQSLDRLSADLGYISRPGADHARCFDRAIPKVVVLNQPKIARHNDGGFQKRCVYMLIDDRNLMRIAGYAAAAAFLGAASLGFPKPVLSWFALLGVAIVAALLVRSPELVDRLRFQEASSIVLVSALATVMGEGLWLEIFAG